MSGTRFFRRVLPAAAAAWLALCGFRGPGFCLTPEQETRLASYETAISKGDPAAAEEFLADKPVISALSETEPQREASLKARAEALKDLKELLAMSWDDSNANSLNLALTIRMDAGKPLSMVGVGPEPEKLLSWLKKYRPDYPVEKIEIVKRAIRQWKVIFGRMHGPRSISWGDVEKDEGVKVVEADWLTWTLRERNAVIDRLVEEGGRFQEYGGAGRKAEIKKQALLRLAVTKVMRSGALSPQQAAQLHDKSLTEQGYLLGSFFDGSRIAVAPDLKLVINAYRKPLPKEVLPYREREVLGAMLNTAVSKELAGTRAGEKVLAFYSGGAKLKLSVLPIDLTYSGYDGASGTITLDSDTIQRFMQMKGCTAASLMKNEEQLRAAAKYLSPLVVYEAGHQMRDAWAKKKVLYNPQVQESEIEAMSLEALYLGEKLKKDPEFAKLLKDLRLVSNYAVKRLEIAAEFSASGSKKFASMVRQRYFAELPSIDAASAQILEAVAAEQSRRSAMKAEARAELESSALSQEEALEMTPEEIYGAAGEIGTPALEKLRKDMTDLGPYKNGYEAFDSEIRSGTKSAKTGSFVKQGAPPIL
ncbi:MAG: hypothetical protein WCW52_04810 [Elusimicrobiales bacterium]|jgi:hypothetical protein